MQITCSLMQSSSNRQWPRCLVCIETGQECTYPDWPLKPGPRLGKRRWRGLVSCYLPFSLLTRSEGSSKRSRKRNLQQSDNDATSPESNTAKKKPDHSHQGAKPSPNVVHSAPADCAIDSTAPRADDGVTVAEMGDDDKTDQPGSRPNINDLSFILHPAHDAAAPAREGPSEPRKGGEVQPTELQKACLILGMTGASFGTI